MNELTWDEFTAAAQACGWIAYVATADGDGHPHAAVVSPGFGAEGVIWFGTRPGTAKARNLKSRPEAAFHWPVGSHNAPGECFARGTAALHHDVEARRRVWESGVMAYDLRQFFGSPDRDDHLFVEVTVTSASVLGPDFVRRRWSP